MAKSLFSNNDIADNYDRRIALEKLTPIGREILKKYKPVRVDARTIKLVKPKNFNLPEIKKVSKKENFKLQPMDKQLTKKKI